MKRTENKKSEPFGYITGLSGSRENDNAARRNGARPVTRKEEDMYNHVTNKITFDASKADEVFSFFTNGKFDFNILVPMPPHVYMGDLSAEDDVDFPINWMTWSRENWGTKWNCYDQTNGIEDGKAFIKFDTAWSAPYPVIAAFANKFAIPFEHRYFDEGHNFWGVEKWGKRNCDHDSQIIARIERRKSKQDDMIALCVELKGYDPSI
jgi:hypothetical protein